MPVHTTNFSSNINFEIKFDEKFVVWTGLIGYVDSIGTTRLIFLYS